MMMMMMTTKMLVGVDRPMLLLWLVAAALVGLVTTRGSLVSGYSEQENIAYVEKILNYLNNNYECTLPTFEEIDKLKEALEELASQESALVAQDGDYALVQGSLLKYWDYFKASWSSPVIARSAKRRSFLCKIEDYQLAKFGSSVCTRVKDIRGPLTDHIFEQNPLVRYLKHLETSEVIERPAEVSTTISTSTLAPTTTTTTTPTTTEPAVAEQVTKITPTTTTTTTEATPAEQEQEFSAGGVDKEMANEESQMNDVKHNSVEYGLKLELTKYKNNGLKIDLDLYDGGSTRAGGGGGDDDDEKRDALDDIPVPAANDKGGLELELSIFMHNSPLDATSTTTQTPEPEIQKMETQTEEPATSTTTALPMFDEHGAEYIEAEYDDARLDQLVRVPKRDWAFDPIYGYFKWPDECNSDACPAEIQLDNSFLSLNGVWAEFTADPYAYDERLEAIRRTTTTTPKPRINAAWLRQQKKALVNSLHDETRRAQMFGWDANNVPLEVNPFEGPIMPELKRDRWIRLADNNYCKLGFNQGRIVDSTKSGLKAVKSFFKGHGHDAFNSRKRLLSGEQQ